MSFPWLRHLKFDRARVLKRRWLISQSIFIFRLSLLSQTFRDRRLWSIIVALNIGLVFISYPFAPDVGSWKTYSTCRNARVVRNRRGELSVDVRVWCWRLIAHWSVSEITSKTWSFTHLLMKMLDHFLLVFNFFLEKLQLILESLYFFFFVRIFIFQIIIFSAQIYLFFSDLPEFAFLFLNDFDPLMKLFLLPSNLFS